MIRIFDQKRCADVLLEECSLPGAHFDMLQERPETSSNQGFGGNAGKGFGSSTLRKDVYLPSLFCYTALLKRTVFKRENEPGNVIVLDHCEYSRAGGGVPSQQRWRAGGRKTWMRVCVNRSTRVRLECAAKLHRKAAPAARLRFDLAG